MPKLPLDRETLKLLPGLAIDAVRHPRRTASQAVSGLVTVAGHLLDQRPASEPVPGMAKPPPPRSEPEGNEPPGPVAAEPEAVEDTVEDLAPTEAEPPDEEPSAEELSDEERVGGEPQPEEPVDEEPPDEELDEGPDDTRPEGPAPHMRPRIAGDVERDYEEDIPGITGHRER